jgi:hypothetical protein
VLNIRSDNALDYYEASGYDDIKSDEFGAATGFQDEKGVINHKFQAESIAGGSQVQGCSALIYNGELDRSVDVNLDNCINHIEQSGLQKWAERSWIPDQRTTEEEAALVQQAKVRDLTFAAENQLALQVGPLKNYSLRPNTFEQGKIPWSQKDIRRGYVVFQRSIQVDMKARTVSVVEFRSDVNGVPSKKVYTKTFAQLSLGGI